MEGEEASNAVPLPAGCPPDWPAENGYYYRLRKLDTLAPLEGRLVIDWGPGALAWVQWLKDRHVEEIDTSAAESAREPDGATATTLTSTVPAGRAQQYVQLVAERRACQRCAGLVNPAAVETGAFDSDHVSPWGRWQGGLHAQLMVVGQDWGDVAYFVRQRGTDEPSNPTNRTLSLLLREVGVDVGLPGDGAPGTRAFFTNAILCLKSGGLQGQVHPEWFRNCETFLRRQVEIIQPRVVAALGQHALNAVRAAFGLGAQPIAEAVCLPAGEVLTGHTRLLGFYHCGARTLNTHRPLELQRRDWARLSALLRSEHHT